MFIEAKGVPIQTIVANLLVTLVISQQKLLKHLIILHEITF